MKIIFASNNKNKIKEIQSLLPKEIEILSLEDIQCFEDIPETSSTIEGNAILKANYVTEKYKLPCFADDSGLEIDALNGAPGVYSARYAGNHKNDSDNIALVLKNLETIEDNRGANFKTVIALNINNQQYLFTGIVKGTISQIPTGTNGFGYDPIFIPQNSTKSFAELSFEEKNKISHRKKAVEQLLKFLSQKNE